VAAAFWQKARDFDAPRFSPGSRPFALMRRSTSASRAAD